MNQILKNALELFFRKQCLELPLYDETPALRDREKGQKCIKIFLKFHLIFPCRKAENCMK